MDFFEQQDAARRRTGWLVFFFALAVVSIVAAIYLLFAVALSMTGDESGEDTLGNALSASPWNLELFVWVGLGTIAVISLSSLYKISQLASGGETVALMLGGRLIDPQTSEPAERRLLNVVEEMALASGTSVPPVYVLDNEASINAFAAGHDPDDAVIGVSRGSLTYLNRDELQGVMAHEFSHILNGDMRLNLRLIGILHGILIIAIIGWYVMRSAAYSSGRSRKKDGGAWLLVVGLGLVVIGFIGVFFGKLIKSAVSRQREYLADASAVQFTRLPDGIAGALKKIGGLSRGSRIEDAHAEEVSHLFFGDAFAGMALNFFSTHPPLVERIQRIDPSFQGKFPKVRPVEAKRPAKAAPEAKQKRRQLGDVFPGGVFPGGKGGAPMGPLPLDPSGVLGRIGIPGLDQILYASLLIDQMPRPVVEAAHEPYGARAVVYALLLDRLDEMRQRQLASLKQRAESLSYQETLRLAPLIDQLAAEGRLPLVELTAPALKKLSPRQYATFRDNVEALVQADGKIELFEYAIHTVLLRHLDVYFGHRKPAAVRHRTVSAVLGPAATVLATLAQVGHDTEAQAERAFEAGMAQLAPETRPSPTKSATLQEFDAALSELAQAAPKVKKRIVAACVACIAADKKVTPRESELLRVVAGTLGCPLPPMVPAAPSNA